MRLKAGFVIMLAGLLQACRVPDECRAPDFCLDSSLLFFTRTARARFVLVSNYNGATVHSYRIDDASGALSFVQSVNTGASPERPSPDGNTGYVYTGDAGGIRVVSLNPDTGAIAQVSNVVGGGAFSQPLFDDAGRVISIQSGGFISIYSRTPSQLVQIGSNVATSTGGQLPIFALQKRFVYIADTGSVNIRSHSVTASGLGAAVTYTAPQTNAQNLKADPFDRAIYMTHGGGSTVTVAALDAGSGVLSTLQSASGVLNPNAIEIDPSGRFLYVNNLSGSTITVFSIAANGSLSQIQSAASSANPSRLTFHPSLSVVYVPDVSLGTMAVYSRSEAGLLSLIQTVSTGTSSAGLGNPYAVTDPRGRFLYLSNSVSNTMSVFRIDTLAGTLTPVQTVTGLNQPRPASLAVYYDF